MGKILSISIAAAALLVLALSAGTIQAAAKQEVAMTFENIGFGDPTEACPGGVVTFDIVSTGGAPLGTGSSCIQSFKGCEPFAVGCHQQVAAIFTFDLASLGPIIVAAKLHEVVLDDDPFTIAQRAHGRVVGGNGHLKGAGTTAFTVEGIESSLVYVLRLTN